MTACLLNLWQSSVWQARGTLTPHTCHPALGSWESGQAVHDGQHGTASGRGGGERIRYAHDKAGGLPGLGRVAPAL